MEQSLNQTKMLKVFEKSHLKKCAEIFFNVYKSEPFNYSWLEQEAVFEYFFDITQTPKFKGFILEVEGQVVGACFGMISDYFKVKKYRISEIFIAKDFEGQGLGSYMLSLIEQHFRQKGFEAIELTSNKDKKSFDFYVKNEYSVLKENVNMIKILE